MPVGNDTFASAGVVPIDFSNPGVLQKWTEAFGSNAALTTETGEPAPTGFASSKSAWWKFTPTATRNVRIDTIGSTGDTEIAVYTGSAVNALTKITSDSDSGGGNTSLIRSLVMNAGTDYYLQVRAFNGVTMNYTVNVYVYPPAPNDLIANYRLVDIAVAGGTFSDGYYDNATCNVEGGEPQPTGFASGKSAWWRYTPVASGSCQVDTIGSLGIGGANADTEIAMYTGGPTVLTLTKVASDSDSGGANTSKFTFSVTGGVTYYIQVSSGGTQMAYRLNVTGPKTAQAYTIAAAPALTLTRSAGAVRGAVGGTTKTLTVSIAAAAMLGLNVQATKALTLTPSAVMSRGREIEATAALTLARSAAVRRDTTVDATAALTLAVAADATVTEAPGAHLTFVDGTGLDNMRYADGSHNLNATGFADGTGFV